MATIAVLLIIAISYFLKLKEKIGDLEREYASLERTYSVRIKESYQNGIKEGKVILLKQIAEKTTISQIVEKNKDIIYEMSLKNRQELLDKCDNQEVKNYLAPRQMFYFGHCWCCGDDNCQQERERTGCWSCGAEIEGTPDGFC